MNKTESINCMKRVNRKFFFFVFWGMLACTLSATAQTPAVQRTDSASQAVEPQEHSGVVGWLLDVYEDNMNYWTVTGLMAVESSFFPFPSEVVVPPAVYFAVDDNSPVEMKWWLVILFGTLGALLGALFNYYLSLWLGRPIIYKFANSRIGHLMQLSQEKMERAEKYFNDHGVVSTLVGRLIPVIRQLISIPAGISRMNIWSFMLFTTIGALVWNTVLALLGYLAHLAGDRSVIERYSHELSIVIIALFVAVVLFFVLRYLVKKRKKAQQEHLS